MRLRKQGGIGNEAVGLGPAAIEAEVVHLPHSDTPHTGSDMLLGLTPGLEGSRIQDGVLGNVLEKSVQRFKSTGLGVEALAQGPLQIHVTLQNGRKQRRERSRCSGHRCSSFTWQSLPGTGRETSRKSPVASRRYADVLAAERCPRMSPMVLRGVPFFRR